MTKFEVETDERVTKTMYKSYDGMEFPTQEMCESYEKSFAYHYIYRLIKEGVFKQMPRPSIRIESDTLKGNDIRSDIYRYFTKIQPYTFLSKILLDSTESIIYRFEVTSENIDKIKVALDILDGNLDWTTFDKYRNYDTEYLPTIKDIEVGRSYILAYSMNSGGAKLIDIMKFTETACSVFQSLLDESCLQDHFEEIEFYANNANKDGIVQIKCLKESEYGRDSLFNQLKA